MVHVPGSRAPSVKVPAFVNSWLRVVTKYAAKLATFVQSFLSNMPRPHEEDHSLRGLWPMPVPYPEVFGRDSAFGGSWRKRRLVLQVLVLNWLHLGRPHSCPGLLWPGRRLSARQWRRVRLLEHLSEDMNSLLQVDAQLMARAALRTESSADQLDALHRALLCCSTASAPYGADTCSPTRAWRENDGDDWEEVSGGFGVFDGESKGGDCAVAKPLQADRLHFVGSPCFNPVPYFDKETAHAYEFPLECVRDDVVDEPPQVSIHGSAHERNLLFQKMAACGRLVPLTADDVRPGLECGLFCVPKDLDRDRLILDARPPNTVEKMLNTWTKTMSSSACLSGIELDESQCLIMSGRDIRDYFYQFTVSPQRCRRNYLAGRLEPEDLEFIFGKKFTEAGYVGLSTLAMGDLNACEFAQGSHIKLVMSCGGAAIEEFLMMHQPCPRGLLSVGVVIDDLVCLQKVLAADVNAGAYVGASLLDERMELIMAKYKEVGLPTNEKKAFDNSLSSSFWGVQVDGLKGLVRANETRLWPLLLITVRVCALGLSTVGLLRSLAGSYISILSLRRRLLSAMNLVFDAIAASSSDKQVLRLSGALIDELFTMMILSTLAVVNLRATTVGVLHATDASDWGMAAVAGVIPVQVAREAMRLSLTKSCWTKLLPPSKAWLRSKELLEKEDELPGGDVYDVHPFWESLARAVPYQEQWRRKHPRPIHVNIGELRAHLIEEGRIGAKQLSVRVPYALDSQVALGSLVKGRASSKALNSELLRSVPTILGSDLYGGYGFWPSKLNRADGPTRDAEPDAPDAEVPWWWDDVCNGRFDRFDSWLKEVESMVAPPVAPDLASLGDPVDIRTGRAFRAMTRQRKRGACEIGGALTPVSEESSLKAEALAILRSFPLQQFLFANGVCEFLEPGALDLYSGKGGVARALADGGCPWVLTFEINRSESENVLLASNKEKITRLVVLRAVKLVGSAMVCKSFSRAVTPAVRTLQYPRGVPWMTLNMKEKVMEGNEMADFGSELHELCEKSVDDAESADVFFWTKNPDSSHVWGQRKYRKYRNPGSQHVFRADYCRFGTRWRKRTRVATNLPKLKGLRMLCTCSRGHQQLRGQHPTLRIPWTLVAQPYPRGFSRVIASAALDACGWAKRGTGKFNIAGCARCSSMRIGEADHPGPRKIAHPRGFSLEEAPVQTWSSIRLGDQQWDRFLVWCYQYVESNVLALFLAVPIFLAYAVRRFGDLEFGRGGSLLYYRHLILVALRRVPQLRPYAGICWDLATRWEKAEPTTHRTPVPEVLVEAMVALAWSMKWKRWCGVCLLCFFGIARAGEVLKCRREDLLLPCDMLYECDAAFLVLRRSKTSYRQLARVQHLKITNLHAVKLLNLIYQGADKDELLFFGSAHVFRRRWDFILQLLEVPANVHVTPGGLRGGGAVTSYRKGASISDLLWAMRLKQVTTLEAYLQEVAALSLLTELPLSSRRAIRSAASLFAFLAFSSG